MTGHNLVLMEPERSIYIRWWKGGIREDFPVFTGMKFEKHGIIRKGRAFQVDLAAWHIPGTTVVCYSQSKGSRSGRWG